MCDILLPHAFTKMYNGTQQRVVVLRHVTLWRSGKQCGIFKEEKDEPAILYSRTCYSKGLEQELQMMISCSAVHTYIKCMLPECTVVMSSVDLEEQKKWKFRVGGRSVCLSPLSLLTVCCATLSFFSLAVRSVSSFAATSGAGRPKSIISAATQTLIHPHRVSLTTYIAIELTLKSTETTFKTDRRATTLSFPPL